MTRHLWKFIIGYEPLQEGFRVVPGEADCQMMRECSGREPPQRVLGYGGQACESPYQMRRGQGTGSGAPGERAGEGHGREQSSQVRGATQILSAWNREFVVSRRERKGSQPLSPGAARPELMFQAGGSRCRFCAGERMGESTGIARSTMLHRCCIFSKLKASAPPTRR